MCILRAEDLCKSYRTAGETLSVLSHVSFQMNTGDDSGYGAVREREDDAAAGIMRH